MKKKLLPLLLSFMMIVSITASSFADELTNAIPRSTSVEDILGDILFDENAEVETACEDNVTDINSKLEEKKINDKMEELERQVEEKEDKYKRLQAEYSNYIRRTQEEKQTIGIFANEKIITELIPVIDSMERAMDTFADKEDDMYINS